MCDYFAIIREYLRCLNTIFIRIAKKLVRNILFAFASLRYVLTNLSALTSLPILTSLTWTSSPPKAA